MQNQKYSKKDEELRKLFYKILKKKNYSRKEVYSLLLRVYEGTYKGVWDAFEECFPFLKEEQNENRL